MDQKIEETIAHVMTDSMAEMIISNSSCKNKIAKIKIRPVRIKGERLFQASEYRGTKIFHVNYNKMELMEQIKEWTDQPLTEAADKEKVKFRQIEIKCFDQQITILISKKGKETMRQRNMPLQPRGGQRDAFAHNRSKNYILKENIPVPFLIDLGVMNKDGKIVKAKYDKYKQINRFLEFIEDILPKLPTNREISVLDFGCGKSYLTFAMYYYLKVLKNYDIRITGLDLKEDVIGHCSLLAEKYHYDKLSFKKGDIFAYETKNGKVDLVVTLHACDTATDYALYKAIKWNASVILSVPCCQHEWNQSMECEMLNPVLQYGLIKERMASLLTDGVRARILEAWGYKTNILEFIDMEHTPKNILIRAVKTGEKGERETGYKDIIELFHVYPTLLRLLEEDINC